MSPSAMLTARATLVPARATAPPLDPSAPGARNQLLHELSKPEYQAASKSFLDYIADWINGIVKSLEDWINSLGGKGGSGGPGFVDITPIVIVGAIVIALIIGFLVFGLPRINRRSRAVGALFGEEDERDSLTLRRAAERAAASGDYATAIAEGFRAIARGLAERAVTNTYPGTTAHGFAEQAAGSFPASVVELRAAADAFDGVRYLGAPGTETDWLTIDALERQLRSARPRLEGVLA